ncbi:hypothetical protein BX600DRAFT_438646 [Xylariales sp. PMI_506]|nr:hypothetical protein BX600DRAFT_438646 [Xylariales sp. PMI_506]
MATWRQMTVDDVEQSVMRIADEIHPDLPESADVFRERVRLFPEGCLVLVDQPSGDTCGYVVSHPIRCRQPPALDSLLGEIAPNADQYYIHDLAILPRMRGYGHAAGCMARLASVAARYQMTCLISIYGTAAFWAHFGFAPLGTEEQTDAALSKKLLNYGDDAIYLTRHN